MSFQLVYLGLIALGKGEYQFPKQQVTPPPPPPQPQYTGFPEGNPFDFGITTPLETAPGTPLYGLETIGDIPKPNKPIYNEEGQLQAGSMNILNWSTGPTYTPPPLEIRNLLSGGL